jgi:hypothetical protein
MEFIKTNIIITMIKEYPLYLIKAIIKSIYLIEKLLYYTSGLYI